MKDVSDQRKMILVTDDFLFGLKPTYALPDYIHELIHTT